MIYWDEEEEVFSNDDIIIGFLKNIPQWDWKKPFQLAACPLHVIRRVSNFFYLLVVV